MARKSGTEKVSIKKGSNGSIVVREGTVENLISIEEQDGNRTVTIKNSATGQVDTIRFDQNTKMISSSLSGESICLDECEDLLPLFASNDNEVSTQITIRISYDCIKKMVGAAVTVSNVVAVILAFIPGTQIGSAVLGVISAAISEINQLTKGSSSHGLEFRVKVTKYYKTKKDGTKQVYRITRRIVKASRY